MGAFLGGAVGGFLGRRIDGESARDYVDRPPVKRTAAWVTIVLLGAVTCAIVGWFLGAWIGNVATRGCQEMDCLNGLLGPVGGDFIGAMIGAAVCAVLARRFRHIPESGFHPGT